MIASLKLAIVEDFLRRLSFKQMLTFINDVPFKSLYVLSNNHIFLVLKIIRGYFIIYLVFIYKNFSFIA